MTISAISHKEYIHVMEVQLIFLDAETEFLAKNFIHLILPRV
jgi:hypothetical protein